MDFVVCAKVEMELPITTTNESHSPEDIDVSSSERIEIVDFNESIGKRIVFKKVSFTMSIKSINKGKPQRVMM